MRGFILAILALPAAPVTGQEPPSPHFFKNVIAVCVGVESYQAGPGRIAKVDYGEKDAGDVAAVLERRYGFSTRKLLGRDATKANIEAAARLGDGLGADDVLLFYFAGHGQVVNPSGSEPEGFLVPYDADLDLTDNRNLAAWKAQAVSMRWLAEALPKTKARHVVVFLDCCGSGYMTRGRGAPLANDMAVHALLSAPSRVVVAATCVTIAGAGGREFAAPALADHAARNGYFTSALLKALDRDKAATLGQLFEGVRSGVITESSKRMIPQLDHLRGSVGEFVFLPKAIPAAEMAVFERIDARKGLAGQAPRGHFVYELEDDAIRRAGRLTKFEDFLQAGAALDYRFGTDADRQSRLWAERVEKYRALSENGDVYATGCLFFCYAKGLGTKPSPESAYQAARRAVQAVNPPGMGKYLLARCYESGWGVIANPEQAAKLNDEAATDGFGLAKTRVGESRLRRAKTRVEADQAVALLLEAAAGGSARADGILGDVYATVLPGLVDQDVAEAVARYKSAVERGDVSACLALSDAHLGSVPGLPPADLAAAEWWLRQAADGGYGPAQLRLAGELFHIPQMNRRLKLSRDTEQAGRFLRLAMGQKVPTALYTAALLYASGAERAAGFEKSHPDAIRSAEAAANVGFAPAHILLGTWYFQGSVTGQDDTKAVSCYRKAADLGSGSGGFLLGLMYESGRGVGYTERTKPSASELHPFSHTALHWFATAAADQSVPNETRDMAKKKLTAFSEFLALEARGIPFSNKITSMEPSEVAAKWKREFPVTWAAFEKQTGRSKD